MWVLTTSLGYVLQFEAYQGTRGRQNTQDLVWGGGGGGGGGGGSVVIDPLSELQDDIGSSYHLTFDNLITLYNLVDSHIKGDRSHRYTSLKPAS